MSVGGRTAHPDTPRSMLRRELAIWLAMFAIYVGLTSIQWAGRQRTAVSNSRWLFDLERSLHIDIELGLNNWLVPREALRVAANYEYALTYIISSFGLLVWLYLRRPAVYRWARTSFIVLNVASLICFAVYPVAPPRLVTDLGFTDTVVLDHTWGSWGSPLVSHANQLAAMPSLHIAWALWVSLILATIASGILAQTVSGIHVMVTLLVIMATANHYLIDAAGGAVVAIASVALVRPRADGSARWVAAKSALARRVALATTDTGDHAGLDWSQYTSQDAQAGSKGEATWQALMAKPVDARSVSGADLRGQPMRVHRGYRIFGPPTAE